ncbi:hypothetical protein [Oceanospirillum sediminis]|uniref:Uncharacterized protein n=1 Tax=Oceanospirillum sediminis TaxID=2760088 RepID=A0A839IMC5_9GAMM|nr:hypothetical protein [Oceanospirillum sediminis]MBB1486375.1 hypothetical protein [Oceanospirillum sediminis]
MGQSKFSDLLKIENTDNVKVVEAYSYSNIVNIENITRTWFQLMVNLNESPKVRSFFANESYDAESGSWSVTPTDYTRNFLTSGVVIYEVTEVESGRVRSIVLTDDSLDHEIDEVHTLSSDSNHEVVALVRWVGCGMRIPKTAKLALNPNIVWPILTFSTDIDGRKATVKIENSANQITWEEELDGARSSGRVQVKDKNFQGQASGDFHIPGKVDEESVHLEMPYTCASFDILTRVHLGDDEDNQMVIFTS